MLNLNHRNLEQTKQIYKLLAKVNGLGPTEISKYMHMHKPDLFIMWDNQIFRDYFHIKTVLKSTATAKRYSKFMLKIRNEIQEAIHTFPSLDNIPRTQALIEFRRHYNNEALLRILDKYNFVTRGQPKERL